MKKAILTIGTLLLLLFGASSLHAEKSLDDYRHDLKTIRKDTTRINLLFKMGYKFINGPSDSLLFYFGEAMKIIDNNLKMLDEQGKIETNEFRQFQKYKARVWIEFGIEYFYKSEYDSALVFYSNALEISQSLNDIDLISECYSELGIVYKNQGNFDKALEYYNHALDMAIQTTDSSWIASCLVNIGNVYKGKGYNTIALQYYLDALKTLEDLNHDRRISACLQSIGDVYSSQMDFNKSLEYYSRALKIANENGDKVRETTCYLNIGLVYARMENFDVARGYYNKALELYEELGYKHELDDCYILIGDTYLAGDEPAKAMAYYNQALSISRTEDDQMRIAEILGKLSKIHQKQENYSRALSLADQSYNSAEKLAVLDLMIEARKLQSEIYTSVGWHEKSLEAFKDYSRLKDSLFNTEKYRAITEMEVKYESEKKEQQLELLREKSQVQELKLSRRNRFYITSVAGFVLFIVIGYILFRNNQLHSRHQSMELEQKLMRSQMNPHFIFNSLIAIQSYIYKQDAITAGDYLAKFADLVRITLENSRVEFVSFEKELKMLNAYLELQALRFDQKFKYNISIKGDFEHNKLMIPPMMAQPFIENAIEHGLRHKQSKGRLEIVFRKEKDDLFICVEDDGVGRERARELSKKRDHQSMATSITHERMEILSKKFKRNFQLEISDLNPDEQDKGTSVRFSVPVREVYDTYSIQKK